MNFFWLCIHMGRVSPVLYGSKARYSSQVGGLSRGNPIMSGYVGLLVLYPSLTRYTLCTLVLCIKYLYEDPCVPCTRKRTGSSGSCRWRSALPQGCDRRRRRSTHAPPVSKSWWSSASAWNKIMIKKHFEDKLSCLFDKNFSSHFLKTTWLPLLIPLEYSWTNNEAQVVEPVRDQNDGYSWYWWRCWKLK